MTLIYAVLLLLVLLAGWLLTVLGLPGNWLMAGATALYAWLAPVGSRWSFGWKVAVAAVVLAAIGEVVELLAGSSLAAKAGGTRRGALAALAGSLVGGVVGIFVGLPIPVVGSILAAVFFACTGALVGAVLGETSAGKSWHASWRVGGWAFVGRLAGTLLKLGVGGLIILMDVVALVW
jgi:uncharacterized protein